MAQRSRAAQLGLPSPPLVNAPTNPTEGDPPPSTTPGPVPILAV
jgi:hypothetical protein